MIELTNQQRAIISAFLSQVRERARIEEDEWWESYQSWAPGARRWRAVYGFGGTDVHTALWWYQYRYKPGSKEWRPLRIIRALVIASERDYVEPELMAVNTVALMSNNNHRKQAYRAFVKKHKVAKFYRHIKPILQRGGVEALFTHPATAETREYVDILCTITKGKLYE